MNGEEGPRIVQGSLQERISPVLVLELPLLCVCVCVLWTHSNVLWELHCLFSWVSCGFSLIGLLAEKDKKGGKVYEKEGERERGCTLRQE